MFSPDQNDTAVDEPTDGVSRLGASGSYERCFFAARRLESPGAAGERSVCLHNRTASQIIQRDVPVRPAAVRDGEFSRDGRVKTSFVQRRESEMANNLSLTKEELDKYLDAAITDICPLGFGSS